MIVKVMDNVYKERVDRIRSIMHDKKVDVLVLTGSDSHDSEYTAPRWQQVRWVSGFTGEAAEMVITAEHAGLWTDSRYFIQAEEQLKDTGIVLHRKRMPGSPEIPEWIAEYGLKEVRGTATLLVDGLSIDVKTVDDIKSALRRAGWHQDEASGSEEGFRIIDAPDVLESVWPDRPAIPVTPIITLGEDIVGETRAAKLVWLRSWLENTGCDSILLTSLDEIAWLLNVRGSDVEYNPVVISYLLVTKDNALWFVRKGGHLRPDTETESTFEEVRADGVEILEYDDLAPVLSQDMPGQTVCVDTTTLNYHIFRLLRLSSCKTVKAASPVKLRKAVKNSTELSGLRQILVEDGVAMEKFLYWIERKMSSGVEITEWDAALQIDGLRAGIPGYMGSSFKTISAYGPNAALPHYETHEETAAILEPHGLYLCDSGGQFMSGTTDITRTVPLGECTPLEMEDYTLVLKGHIGLAMAVFPAGTTGAQIDYAARCPLWQYKRDFGHGTGHGVGFFLNVHEGPQEIRHNLNPNPMLPGMVTSDEPGLYRQSRHGIRHENLLLCVEDGDNEFGVWRSFETLTLCHFDTFPIIRDLLTDDEVAWLNAYNAAVYATLSPHLDNERADWLRYKTLPI